MSDEPWADRARAAVDALPGSVRIGALDFMIRPWQPMQQMSVRRYGECSTLELTIRISRDMASPVKVVDTFTHEVLHAIFWACGIEDDDKEERTVGLLAKGLTAFYRDNPWYLDWVKASLA